MKRPIEARAGEEGFTLIEALIAMVILTFGLIAVANLFVVATSSNQIALYTTVSSTEATRVMERLKAVPFNALPTAGVSPGGATHDAADPWNLVNWSNAADFGGVNATPDVVVAGNLVFNSTQAVPGAGNVVTRWKIINPGAGGSETRYILVRSEVLGLFGRGAVSQFSTWRSCTGQGCP